MKIFEVGRNPYSGIGDPRHILLDDANAGAVLRRKGHAVPPANPKLTEAVIAAVKAMNRYDQTPTSIMGDPDLDLTERLVQATNKDVLAHRGKFDDTTTVRWGLFVKDWQTFKERAANATAEQRAAFKAKAIEWAQKVSSAIKKTANAASGWPMWKKLLAILAGGLGVIFVSRAYQARQQSAYEEG